MNPDSTSRPLMGLQRILELTATILLGFVLSLLMSFFLLGNGKIDRLSSLSPCRLLHVNASLQWCDGGELTSQVCAEVEGAACYVFSRLMSATYICAESEHIGPFLVWVMTPDLPCPAVFKKCPLICSRTVCGHYIQPIGKS